jgi:hypothetical protein
MLRRQQTCMDVLRHLVEAPKALAAAPTFTDSAGTLFLLKMRSAAAICCEVCGSRAIS